MSIASGLVRRICLMMVILQISCKAHKGKFLFEQMQHTGIDFENKVTDGQIENSFLFRNFYNGGGVAIGDINNDGLADVFMTSNSGSNKLFLNKGNFTFSDITDKAGFRQHVGGKYFRISIVVNIRNIGAHGRKAGMAKKVFEFILKSSVLLIYV